MVWLASGERSQGHADVVNKHSPLLRTATATFSKQKEQAGILVRLCGGHHRLNIPRGLWKWVMLVTHRHNTLVHKQRALRARATENIYRDGTSAEPCK